MAILTFFYKNGLWISWPVFGLGVFLLWFFIVTAVRLGDRNRICSLPLQAEQSVEFPGEGRVVLWLEGPQFTARLGRVRFELTGIDGSSVESRMVLFRQRSSGLSRVRITDRIFTIPYPGSYVLHARGLGEPKPGDERHRLIFMRPHLPQTVGSILGIILGALLAIGSIVNFFLRLSQGGGP